MSEFEDALGGRDRVNSEMHLLAATKRVWRCTWRPRLSELRDTLASRDRASLEIHWEAVIEWTQRCTWRPSSSEFGDALGGRSSQIGGVLGGAPGAKTAFISYLTRNRGNVTR
jgi:hypothetical protein